MLVSDLKTGIKRYGFDDKDPLLVWINAAYHQIEKERMAWSWLEELETFTLEPNTARFTITNGAKRFVKIRDTSDETQKAWAGKDLEYWGRSKLLRSGYNLTQIGNPELYTILKRDTLQVWPVPNAQRTLEVWYIKELEDLVEDTEEPGIPVADHYTIVLGAAAIALQAENEEDRAATAQSQFEVELSRMVTADEERQVGEPDYVEDVNEE